MSQHIYQQSLEPQLGASVRDLSRRPDSWILLGVSVRGLSQGPQSWASVFAVNQGSQLRGSVRGSARGSVMGLSQGLAQIQDSPNQNQVKQSCVPRYKLALSATLLESLVS